MTLEEKIRQEIERFRSAVYGEDVRESYAEIAELVCIDAMKAVDHAVEQGNYAEGQGDYAKEQGDYAKEQGEFAGSQTETALTAIQQAMLKIEGEFGSIKDIINSTENGELLLEINELLNDMYRQASDTDIDDIIAGTYTDAEDSAGDTEAGTLQAVANIADNAFKEG